MSPATFQRSLLLAGISVLSLANALPAANNASKVYEYSRDPKTLMYFPFVKLVIPPEPCGENVNSNTVGNAIRQGVCLPPGGCKTAGGVVVSSGTKCNNGFGECCTVTAKCNTDNTILSVREYVTVLEAPDPKNTQCTFQIRRKKDACQVRLDFVSYSSTSANSQGNCDTSSLRIGRTVTTPRGLSTCGNLAGQHMYLTFGTGSDTIEVTPRLDINGNYKIIATQIPCYSKRIAPSYCLQYFNRSSDIVKSFDFGRQQQNNQAYTICVENSEQSDTIRWEQCSAAESGVTAGINPINTFFITGVANNANPTAALQTTCRQDWVQVNGQDRTCGITFPQVQMGVKPFNLQVNFDEKEAFQPPFPVQTATETTCPGFTTPQYTCTWLPAPDNICLCVFPVRVDDPNNPGVDIDNQGFCLRYTMT